MNPTTRTALKVVWNVLVIAFACFASVVLLRRIIPQFTHAVAPEMVAAGFEGLGILLWLLVACAIVTSPLWFRCSIWVRVVLALLFVALLVGAYYVDRTFQQALGPYAYMTPTWDYITFFGTYLALTLPLLLFGCGYPALFSRFFTRQPNDRNA